MPEGAALLAVGGYGRGELFPHSDVDVLVLLPAATPTRPDARRPSRHRSASSRPAGTPGWRSARACARWPNASVMAQSDVTVQTALLESRCLCGSRRVFNHFRRVHAQAMDPKAFLRAKTLEMRQRHQKYEDTPYSLEPNCKESPGGLRDLQVVIWVARAAGLGKNWSELAANGLITPFEVKQLQRNEGLLKLIRARLHMIAGRREDRLVFDLQTAVAESFGYRSTRAQRASEVLMRRYYWAAKAVTQLNQILMLNIEERINGSQDAPMRPINATVPRPRRHARGRQRRPVRARPARHPRDLPRLPADGRPQGPVGADAARAVQRPRPDGRQVPPRPGQPRDLHGDPAGSRSGRRMPSG